MMRFSKLTIQLWFFTFSLNNILCIASTSEPRVQLLHGGVLVGSVKNTVSGKSLHAFQGIPYAKPPVGNLRFKAPLPYGAWEGEKLADRPGSICPQQNYLQGNSQISGSEDCLFLNVYAPENMTIEQPLPVMLFLHGGAWSVGAGSIYGPERLLDHQVILVTCNYRLGMLGFLTTGTRDSTGNYGLKDQVMALQWIKDNIVAFNGNPNDVTLFGSSVGSASVNYHMYSPLSRGLFHKAILQSGTVFDCWAFNDKHAAIDQAKKLVNLLKCDNFGDSWNAAVECLRRKPFADIVKSIEKFLIFDVDPIAPIMPTIEPKMQGAFLTENPRHSSEDSIAPMPVMIGVDGDEGIIRSANYKQREQRMTRFPPSLYRIVSLTNDQFKKKFEEIIPVTLYYDKQSENVRKHITAAIDRFYFKENRDWCPKNHFNLTNLLGDRLFYTGTDKFLRKRLSGGKINSATPTYFYVFDQKTSPSITNFPPGNKNYFGVSHGDELLYLFDFHSGPSENSNTEQVATLLPKLWTNFAKTGNPNPSHLDLPEWKSATKFPLEFVRIGSQDSENWKLLQKEVGFNELRFDFWRQFESTLNE